MKKNYLNLNLPKRIKSFFTSIQSQSLLFLMHLHVDGRWISDNLVSSCSVEHPHSYIQTPLYSTCC